jgi:hypothetical protein
MWRIGRLGLVGLLGVAVHAHASISGNEFLRLAQSNRQAAIYYTAGFLDSAGVSSILRKQRQPVSTPDDICPPDGAEPSHVLDIILNELNARPQDRQQTVAVIAWFALAKAWPCKR